MIRRPEAVGTECEGICPLPVIIRNSLECWVVVMRQTHGRRTRPWPYSYIIFPAQDSDKRSDCMYFKVSRGIQRTKYSVQSFRGTLTPPHLNSRHDHSAELFCIRRAHQTSICPRQQLGALTPCNLTRRSTVQCYEVPTKEGLRHFKSTPNSDEWASPKIYKLPKAFHVPSTHRRYITRQKETVHNEAIDKIEEERNGEEKKRRRKRSNNRGAYQRPARILTDKSFHNVFKPSKSMIPLSIATDLTLTFHHSQQIGYIRRLMDQATNLFPPYIPSTLRMKARRLSLNMIGRRCLHAMSENGNNELSNTKWLQMALIGLSIPHEIPGVRGDIQGQGALRRRYYLEGKGTICTSYICSVQRTLPTTNFANIFFVLISFSSKTEMTMRSNSIMPSRKLTISDSTERIFAQFRVLPLKACVITFDLELSEASTEPLYNGLNNEKREATKARLLIDCPSTCIHSNLHLHIEILSDGLFRRSNNRLRAAYLMHARYRYLTNQSFPSQYLLRTVPMEYKYIRDNPDRPLDSP
ncbi:hypothetical protein ACRALDRAFT_205026 [Sodiomyces alcalophilus JCM 7366]|uniref:uncharacterized protein n=1 Tax=Sodiomyces alcalophilus JCM 7366 TaxID=591952 RepID=UPI0039B6E266